MLPQFEPWKECTRCDLCKTRRNVVLGRGPIPARVLMIGEGPGKAEDTLGEPFVGPSGRLLETGIRDAMKNTGLRFRPSIFITNVVGCRPIDDDGGNREPTPDEMKACAERVELTVRLVKPEVVVMLGDVARRGAGKLFPSGHPVRVFVTRHPAFVARKNGMAGSEYVALVRNLSAAFKALGVKTVGVNHAS